MPWFFFFNDTATTEIYTLSLHDALPISVSSKQRFPVFPDVPTFIEMGLKDFEILGWFGIAAPGGTPRDIVKKRSEEHTSELQSPDHLACRLLLEKKKSPPICVTVTTRAL